MSRQQSEKNFDQGDRFSSAFISFNETTWWVFNKAMIVGVCVPIIRRGRVETCENESETLSLSGGCCCGGRTPLATACRSLADWAAPLVVREKSMAVAIESI